MAIKSKNMEVVDVSWSSLKVLHESGTVLSGASLCIGLLDRQQLRQRGWWKQDLGVKKVNWFASFLFKVQVSTSSRCLGKGCKFYLILACVHSHMFHLYIDLYSFFMFSPGSLKSYLLNAFHALKSTKKSPLGYPYMFDGQNPSIFGRWNLPLRCLTRHLDLDLAGGHSSALPVDEDRARGWGWGYLKNQPRKFKDEFSKMEFLLTRK